MFSHGSRTACGRRLCATMWMLSEKICIFRRTWNSSSRPAEQTPPDLRLPEHSNKPPCSFRIREISVVAERRLSHAGMCHRIYAPHSDRSACPTPLRHPQSLPYGTGRANRMDWTRLHGMCTMGESSRMRFPDEVRPHFPGCSFS